MGYRLPPLPRLFKSGTICRESGAFGSRIVVAAAALLIVGGGLPAAVAFDDAAAKVKAARASAEAERKARLARERAIAEVKAARMARLEVEFVARDVLIRDVAVERLGMPGPPAAATSTEPADSAAVGGAALKTNPELERKLRRAEEFAERGRYDLAVVLWQNVLDESGDTLMTRDDWVFRTLRHTYRKYASFSEEIERTLARLPADGLKVYRLTADGEAKAALAAGGGEKREQALAEVVRRFFLSSFGDDAAFELACLQMDRHEFVGASRLLAKILEEYPDPSVPRSEILLRLTVALARLGDAAAARAALAELENAPPLRGPENLVDLVADDVRQTGRESTASATWGGGWPMALGGPSRTGHMQAIPVSAAAQLANLWTFESKLELTATPVTTQPRVHFSSGVRRQAQPARPAPRTREQLIERWKSVGWVPTGQLLFDDDRVYFKARLKEDEFLGGKIRQFLICCDAATGKLRWRNMQGTDYELDPRSQLFLSTGMGGTANRPRYLHEVELFGDRVHQQTSIADGVIYSIEGPAAGEASGNTTDFRSRHHRGIPRRTRRNWLAAYETSGGKLKWRRSAQDVEKDTKFHVGFLSAPVPYATLLLVPVTDNGELWLYALDPQTPNGRTVWKTYLCDEPAGGASHWSPVGLAVDSGDAYVATGAGVIFAVDALSGNVRWAVRHPRTGRPAAFPNQAPGTGAALLDLEGLKEDVVIPHGRRLVVLTSDYNQIFCLDRRTGEFLWDSPVQPSSDDKPVEYCLGVVGDDLFLAGTKVVRKYDIPSGLLRWQKDLKDGASLGRGALTGTQILLPVKDSVLRIGLDTGEDAGQTGVFSEIREPVGNLYSDGKRLLVTGAGRVYALTFKTNTTNDDALEAPRP